MLKLRYVGAVWCFTRDAVIGGVGVGQCQRCMVLNVLLKEPFGLHHGRAAFDVLGPILV